MAAGDNDKQEDEKEEDGEQKNKLWTHIWFVLPDSAHSFPLQPREAR